MNDQKKQIRTGIVGAGKIIPQSVQAMREQGSLLPVAICSRQESYENTQNVANVLQIPEVYPDVDVLLSKANVETVYIAVSNDAHYEVAKKVLEAGRHVLMEKPFCANKRQAAELFDLAGEKRLICMEAAPVRFAPVIRQITKWLPKIGRIRIVQTNYSQYSSRYEQFCAGERPAAFDPMRAGGALMDLGIYQVHLLLSLFGMPETYQYTANIVRDIDTSGVLEMRYQDFLCSNVTAKDCDGICGFQIQGESGYITSDCRANDITRAELHLQDGSVQYYDEKREGHRFIHEMERFSGMVHGGKWEECERLAEGTLDSLRILDGAREQIGIIG